MKATLLALLALSCSFQAFAQGPSLSEGEFCADRKEKNFVKELASDPANLMAFSNHGGILNGGVCWWHSRFQRNALYLTIYKPELPRLSTEETRKLISDIRHAKKVVVVPGYRNFREFSEENASLIQRELEKWQKGDGVLRFAWVRGLSGDPKVAPEKMKQLMDQIYEDVEVKNNISYSKLQIPGIEAHAWLVVHMEKVSNGYDLEILDSNIPNETQIYRYREGDTEFGYHIDDHGSHYTVSMTFTPYLANTKEMSRIDNVIDNYCNQNSSEERLANR